MSSAKAGESPRMICKFDQDHDLNFVDDIDQLTQSWVDEMPELLNEMGIPDLDSDELATYSRCNKKSILKGLAKLRERITQDSVTSAKRELEEMLGRMSGELGARYAWIFLKDEKSQYLETCVTHNTEVNGRVALDRTATKSIVSFVAKTGNSYVCDSADTDEWFLPREELRDVKSAIGVPLRLKRVAGPFEKQEVSEETIGVALFEASEYSAFSSVQEKMMLSAALKIIPYLLILKSGICESSIPTWFPMNNWDLDSVFSQYLRKMIQRFSKSEKSPRTSCTLWDFDAKKEVLLAIATTQFDFEYADKKLLPQESLTGDAAQFCRGKVLRAKPGEYENYRGKEKAKSAGVESIVSAPVYIPEVHEQAVAVLNFYYSDESPGEHYLSDAAVSEIASILGGEFSHLQRQRRQVAEALCRYKVESSKFPLHALLNSALEILGAEEGTVFVLNREESCLEPVVSTGLEIWDQEAHCWKVPDQSHASANKLKYHLDDPGFTSYLGRNPGVVVRKHDVPDPDEKGMPKGFPRVPANHYRETGSNSPSDHRRFIGISVVDQKDNVLGIIRILRPSDAKPFRKADEFLLKAFAEIAKPFLAEEQRSRSQKIRVKNPDDRDKNQEVRMVDAFSTLVGTSGRGQFGVTMVNPILQAIASIVSGDLSQGKPAGPKSMELFVGLYEECQLANKNVLNLQDSHYVKRDWKPDGHSNEIKSDSYVSMAIRDSLAITVNGSCENRLLPKDQHPLKQVKSAAIVPVRTWSNRGMANAAIVLMLDREIEWRASYMALIQYAAQRLHGALSCSGRLYDDCHDAVGFASFVADSLDAEWAELTLSNRLIQGSRKPRAGTRSRKWLAMDRQIGRFANARRHLDFESASEAGIKLNSKGTAIKLPLQYGSSEVGFVVAGPLTDQFRGDPFTAICDCYRKWSELSVQHFELGFERQRLDEQREAWTAELHVPQSLWYEA